jgi:hypothetical protein
LSGWTILYCATLLYFIIRLLIDTGMLLPSDYGEQLCKEHWCTKSWLGSSLQFLPYIPEVELLHHLVILPYALNIFCSWPPKVCVSGNMIPSMVVLSGRTFKRFGLLPGN